MSTRPDRVDGRRERSRRTTSKVVAAALERFGEHGYVDTTIESIAASAGVAVQTVYYLFGSKPRLLRAALDATIVGDDSTVALLDRGWEDAIATAPDAATAVRRVATLGTAVLHRVAPLLDVVRRAASIAEIGELYEETRQRRRDDQRHIVELLAGAGHLRPGLDVVRAADVLYGLMSEELYVLLVDHCGWSIDRFEDWLADTLTTQLTGA